ncbi:MFS transporter [Pseudonocardia kunmingensis]|uniref:MFS transporter n=1 Tax=Pseudonocardia kunmingensis TaxID=630975 RepID=UPI001478D97B|nr:MFS transporter [Pseudonocardia kunmingensis]
MRPRLPTGALLGLLTIGTFAVGADSFVLAGMLSPIASDLSVSVAAAGQLTTAFAVTYAVAAPALAVLLGNGDRRFVLAAGGALFALGAALQASSTSMPFMLVAQVLAGAGAALYVSNATATAGALVPEARRGRALAMVYGGFTVATLAGGPLGLVAAQAVGWRGVLGVVAAFGVAAALGTLALPAVHLPKATMARRVGVLGRRAVLVTLLVTMLAQAAVMGAQVYLPTILTPAAGPLLPVLLAATGGGIVVGTWASGRLVDRTGPDPIRYAAFAGLTLVLGAAIPVVLGHVGWLFVVMPVFGLFAGMVLVPQQHRLVAAAPDSPAVALGWGSSAIYLGAAVGSVAGGAVLAGAGPVWLGPLAAGLVVLALLATRLEPRTPRDPAFVGRTPPFPDNRPRTARSSR